MIAAQDAPPRLGEIECSYSTIVGPCPAMRTSEMGQSRWFGDVRATSALPLIADARCEDQQVRKVPTTDVKDNVARRAGCIHFEPPMGMHRPPIPRYAPSGVSQSHWPKGQFHDSAIRLTISQ